MPAKRADIITQLQREILPLQGFKQIAAGSAVDMGLGVLKYAFPAASFPIGAVHEFVSIDPEDTTATRGFILALMSALMGNKRASVWITSSSKLFPPALKSFGIEPDQIIFVDLQNEKEVLWATEEALKCDGLAAVVGEIPEISFTASRRLQLAVEQSRVTGFILRPNANTLNTSACIARWKITSLPSLLHDDMPGVGFPHWQVQLLKVRNGKPGSWEIEWCDGKFRHIPRFVSIPLHQQQKKTG